MLSLSLCVCVFLSVCLSLFLSRTFSLSHTHHHHHHHIHTQASLWFWRACLWMMSMNLPPLVVCGTVCALTKGSQSLPRLSRTDTNHHPREPTSWGSSSSLPTSTGQTSRSSTASLPTHPHMLMMSITGLCSSYGPSPVTSRSESTHTTTGIQLWRQEYRMES